MDYLELTHKKLDLNEINDIVCHESCGAVSFFVGTTRDNFEDKQVVSLEYEAYDKMATKAMKSICDQIRQKWPDVVNIAIYHRLGLVAVKESSVIIGISSPHRNTSLESVQFAIEALKKVVPIWKKEKYSDTEGSSQWKENKESSKRKFESNNISIKKKLKKIDFEKCLLSNDSLTIPNDLIQITANEKEIERRVNCFVERKREDIDLSNIQYFIEKKTNINDDNEISSCARVDSVIVKTKNSKGHLKVQRVKNEFGPQTEVNYKNELDKLMDNKASHCDVNIKTEFLERNKNLETRKNLGGVEERLQNVENMFGIAPPISMDVYERLKKIENKLLYLEGISPEYFSLLEQENHQFKDKRYQSETKITKKTYSVSELDQLIKSLQSKTV